MGGQYEIVCDWDANIWRWRVANEGVVNKGRDIEPLFLFLLKLAKPLSFFGWLMLCAAAELYLIHKFTRKFVQEKYYWITYFLLMINPLCGMWLVNSNRQTVAMLFTWVGILILMRERKTKKDTLKQVTAAALFIYAAMNIHTGAAPSLLFLIVPFVLPYILKLPLKWLLIIFNGLFTLRFFVDFSSILEMASIYWGETDIEGFDNYIEEIGNSAEVQSVFNQLVFWILLNGLVISIKKFPYQIQIMAFLAIVGIICKGFVTNTLSRSFNFLDIFVLWTIPNAVGLIKTLSPKYRTCMYIPCAYVFMYYLWYFYKETTGAGSPYFENWVNFKSILEAPVWL